jgi:acetylornithine deacetylase/succinyl-diaminopimelate desuccinylase-like protein
MHKEILAEIEAQKDRYLEELKVWLRIPSISADKAYKAEVLSAADFLMARLREAGMPHVELLATNGYPLVFAEKIVDKNLPTVLIYGHYDVQPPDPLELWTSPAFEPMVKDGKIYARGACDDKGQVYMHVKAIDVLEKLGGLPVNIKFLIEGEEESGSESFGPALDTYRSKLDCDVILVSDTSMISLDTPSLTVSLRGLAYLEVEVTGPNRDLHSGVYGGAVDNPLNVLCQMIASLKDSNGRITIPTFYDKVRELGPEDRAKIAAIPYSHDEYCKALDIADTFGETGFSVLEQVGIRPTLDVNGIWGGYTGEGAKTVLPSKASAKISMRLVPHQVPEEITQLFTEHFKRIAPKTVKVKVTPHHGGMPFYTDTALPVFRTAEQAMQLAFNKVPLPTYEGGSIPILSLMTSKLNAPVVLMGFGLDSDAIHSPNEHYGVANFLKGIETISLFHTLLAKR